MAMDQTEVLAELDGRFAELNAQFDDLWEMQARADWTDTSFKVPISIVMAQMKFLVDAHADLLQGRTPGAQEVH